LICFSDITQRSTGLEGASLFWQVGVWLLPLQAGYLFVMFALTGITDQAGSIPARLPRSGEKDGSIPSRMVCSLETRGLLETLG